MTAPVTPISSPNRSWGPLAVLLLAGATLAQPAAAQVIPDPDATEVAKTPLRDFNIEAREIPAALVLATLDPYAPAGDGTCDAVVSAIAELDQVLGADYDIAVEGQSNPLSLSFVGQGIVGAIIPFRGIVREVSGAAANERELQAAYTGGMVRRAFLKGHGLGKGCPYPARPKPPTIAE